MHFGEEAQLWTMGLSENPSGLDGGRRSRSAQPNNQFLQDLPAVQLLPSGLTESTMAQSMPALMTHTPPFNDYGYTCRLEGPLDPPFENLFDTTLDPLLDDDAWLTSELLGPPQDPSFGEQANNLMLYNSTEMLQGPPSQGNQWSHNYGLGNNTLMAGPSQQQFYLQGSNLVYQSQHPTFYTSESVDLGVSFPPTQTLMVPAQSPNIFDNGFLSPVYSYQGSPTSSRSRNSSLAQESTWSGPSTPGFGTDQELSEAYSPSSPFSVFTPGSVNSDLQSDGSPRATSFESTLHFPSSTSKEQCLRRKRELRIISAYRKLQKEFEGPPIKISNRPSEKNREASNLRRSDKSVEAGDFICPVENCGQSYTRPNTVITHLKNHFPRATGKPEKIHRCPQPGCTYASKRTNDFKRHLKTHS